MHNKPDLSIKLKLDLATYLREYIDIQVEDSEPFEQAKDKVVLAALWEIRRKIGVRMENGFRQEYRVKLSACQAIALHVLYQWTPPSINQWFHNELRKISDLVHRHYEL